MLYLSYLVDISAEIIHSGDLVRSVTPVMGDLVSSGKNLYQHTRSWRPVKTNNALTIDIYDVSSV